MANELRIYQDLLGGRTTDNPLSSSATTLNSTALAAMVAVGSTQHMMLVLDPDGLAGAPEIVKVTAHTAAATSCTIARGQEGTTARAHAQGTDWVHAAVASDLTVMSTVEVASDSAQAVTASAVPQLTGMSIALPATSPAGLLLVTFATVCNPTNTSWEYIGLQVKVDASSLGNVWWIERRNTNAVSGERRSIGGVITAGRVSAGAHTITLHATDGGGGTGITYNFEYRRMGVVVLPGI